MLSNRSYAAAALSVCAGLAVTTADAEIFQRIMGDSNREITYSIERTHDGGYITTGLRDEGTADAPDEDVLITKHKSDGSIEWQRLYRGEGRDIGYSVQQTADRGYIVAAESTSAPAGFGILLIRLDAAGSFVWAGHYAGSFMADPIHSPHPGVALDQGFDGEIYVTGNFSGTPLILAVAPGGGLIWEALYTDPAGPDGGAKYAFTDIKFDRISGSLVVSGTSVRPGFVQPGVPPIDVQDAFMMRTGPGGAPIWAWHYNFPVDLDPDNEPIPNVRETGDGLDLGPNGDIVLNGRTDFGGPVDPDGTHLIGAFPDGVPAWSAEYTYARPDGVSGRPATAYAAVRFDNRLNIVQTGRIPDEGGRPHAWESLTGFGGAPIWFWEYGGERPSRGESVIPTPEPCGYAMAGQFFTPDGPFARGETYLVKNNDPGESGCLERRWSFVPQFEAEPREALVRPEYVQEWILAQDRIVPVDAAERVFCYDDDCAPGDCPCDINGDGILDLADIGGFITCFTTMMPCGDLDSNSVWDLSDIGLFISCFNTGCP